jgi:undecaprenyl-diphosphatase
MSIAVEARRRYASAAFVALLILSVFWPSPIVSVNRLWLDRDVAVDELSFLGREAPSWDVVFWCAAGLLLLAIAQSAVAPDFGEPLRQVRAMRFSARTLRIEALAAAAGGVITALVWLFVDAPALAWAERIQSEQTETLVRLLNRLGGGMNPALVVGFFLVAGVAYAERRWVSYAIAMAGAGLGAGIGAQIVKNIVGRARPELWLGPSHYAPGSSTSFPSGHTVGAFALGGVLLFASRSPALRATALLLAAAIGLSRILAFRHWPSDVVASAILGLLFAYVFTRSVTGLTSGGRDGS